MKIVHLIDYFQPKVGYQETFLARQQKKLGHEVFVLTSDRYNPFPNYAETYKNILGKRIVGSKNSIEEGIRTIRLKAFELPKTSLIYLRGLNTKLKSLKPDVIHCHGVFSLTSFQVAFFKPELGYKLIFDTHAAHFNTIFNTSVTKKLYKNIYVKFFWNKIRYSADSIFAIGIDERDFLCETVNINKNEIPVIHLGVDTDRFRYNPTTRDRIRKELKIRNEETVVIFTGKVTPNKDVHILAGAIGNIKDKKVKLLIIGKGESGYLSSIKKIVPQDRLICIDFVENKILPAFYNAADMAVWPGDSTIAILEALACSLPVILPEDFVTEYLDASQAIIRFKRGDSLELAGNIRHITYNSILRIRLRKRALSYARKNLSWEKRNQQILQLIK